MFRFNGTIYELKSYLNATFTKRALKTIDLGVYAHGNAVNARGNYNDVRGMLRLVFTEKHLQTMQLSVDIYQPVEPNAQGIRKIECSNIPANVTLDEIHHAARAGQKIAAIKAYRTLAGVDLRAAKDYIDKYLDQS